MMHRPTLLALTLAASAAMFVAMVGFAPSAEANNAGLVCCENENGTYHPVSTNGRAADYCVQTWDIPEGEAPGQYCDDGPQCPTDLVGIIDYCASRLGSQTNPDFVACMEPSCAPDEFSCFLGVDTDGQLYCFS